MYATRSHRRSDCTSDPCIRGVRLRLEDLAGRIPCARKSRLNRAQARNCLVVGKGLVQWRFKRSDEDGPDPERRPTAEDWDALEEKVEGLYNRRRA